MSTTISLVFPALVKLVVLLTSVELCYIIQSAIVVYFVIVFHILICEKLEFET